MTTSPRLISIPTCPPFLLLVPGDQAGLTLRLLGRRFSFHRKYFASASMEVPPEDNLRYDQVAWMGSGRRFLQLLGSQVSVSLGGGGASPRAPRPYAFGEARSAPHAVRVRVC